MRLARVPWRDVPWADLDGRADRSIFQTQAWLAFLATSQDAEPVVAQVTVDGAPRGWFTGALVRWHGLRILGSPLRGWTTSYMGFTLDDPSLTAPAAAALARFAFDDLRCVHVELMDRSLAGHQPPAGYRCAPFEGYEARLDVDDDELLARMRPRGRRDVRRALRNGVRVEEVDRPADHEAFVAEYHRQVTEGFAKRGLRPTYSRDRVAELVEHVGPTGRLLLLRAFVPDVLQAAATGIFAAVPGGTAVFLMGGSWRAHQALLPNEALMWHAMRALRDRGAVRLDFGGGGTYKAKYGGSPISVPWLRRSRWAALDHGRTWVARRARRRQARPAGGRSAGQ